MRNKSVILQIGLITYEPSWELMLRQIGVSWKVITPIEHLIENYSVIIINASVNESLHPLIESFIVEGGVVLHTTASLNNQNTIVKNKQYISSLPPVLTSSYSIHGILDVYKECFFFANNDIVDIIPTGNGFRAYFGIPIDIILSSDTQRKNFYTESHRMPNEIVAKQTKGTFRQLIQSLLVHLHQIQQIPFVHKWYYPHDAPTIFTFRIDSDKGTQEQVEEIFQLSEKFSIPTTWFLDVKSHEQWIEYFNKFTSQEIAVHCYEHSISRDKETNFDNFSKAKSILARYGMNGHGFSAPTGMWNESFASTIDDLGFHYSSEFGYDYDNLPSFPFRNGSFSQVPQLPIHPICIGSMLRSHMSNNEMISYYKDFIDTQQVLNEPICLYHHPTHEHNEVFEEIFNYIQKKNIPKLSYTDYAAWWKQRDSNQILWRYENGRLIALNELPDHIYTKIILPNGRESITHLRVVTESNQLEVKPTTDVVKVPSAIMQSRKFDIRHIVQNTLDWWIKITE